MAGSIPPRGGWSREEAQELLKAFIERLDIAVRRKWPVKRVWVAGDYVLKSKKRISALFILLETGNKLDKETDFFKFLRESEPVNKIALVSTSCHTSWHDGVSTEDRFKGQRELLWQGSSVLRKTRR
jgi:hypothetical protein